jgi:NOL1/NOP2/sun family putative RNA methylase
MCKLFIPHVQQSFHLKLPVSLIQSLQHATGFDEAGFIAVHDSPLQVTSIRFNTGKPSAIEKPGEKIPWASQGYYLNQRPSFTSDPLFHAGAYYVQEASSMFLEEVLQQTAGLLQPVKVLDLCAAPGGKSTLIQSLISAESLLVSNEVIKTRVNILSENISKWGAANVIVANNDPKDFQRLPDYFDIIVIDAPCSGSGLFRKDPAAIEEWSLSNVQLCSQRQQRILADVYPSLKENGILIYSTCSYSTEEDELICDWMTENLQLQSISLKVESDWGIVETESAQHKAKGYRFYPGKVKGEGFFIAAFKKNGIAVNDYPQKKERHAVQPAAKNEIAVVSAWLKNAADFFFIKQNDEIIAVPGFLQQELQHIQTALYLKKAGVRLGAVIRNELIPHHELAISTIAATSLPSVEVDIETALQYLRRQDIKINSSIKGWALIKYRDLPLGWVKILPNRINNYYPKEWRILNK